MIIIITVWRVNVTAWPLDFWSSSHFWKVYAICQKVRRVWWVAYLWSFRKFIFLHSELEVWLKSPWRDNGCFIFIDHSFSRSWMYKSFHLFYFLPDSSCLSTVVSEAFVRFFVEMVGHYSLFMGGAEREDESISSPTSPSPSSSSSSSSPSASFQREAFRKAVTSKSLRRFLEVFMETQMFTSFIQERELRRQGLRGTEPRAAAVGLLYRLEQSYRCANDN